MAEQSGTAVLVRITLKQGVRLVAVLSLFVLSASRPTHAQHSEIDALASRMAAALIELKQGKVAVFDFSGPDVALTALGQTLADEFSLALVKSGATFGVMEHSQLQEVIQKNRLAPDAIRDMDVAFWLGKRIDVSAIIIGHISTEAGGIRVQVDSYRNERAKRIGGFSVLMPLTKEMETLLADTPIQKAVSQFPKTGDGLAPKCVHCPYPQFPPVRLARHSEVRVMLGALINESGRATNITVVKGTPGFTVTAIETVLTWSFQPATDPDGKAVAVWSPIEVIWRLD